MFWERCLYGYDKARFCLRQRAEGGRMQYRMYLDVDDSYTDSGAARVPACRSIPSITPSHEIHPRLTCRKQKCGAWQTETRIASRRCLSVYLASCSLLSKSAGSWFRACVYIRQKSINARSILSIKPRPIHNVSQSRKQICSPDDTISWMYQLQDAL